jgi:hypothetical protein
MSYAQRVRRLAGTITFAVGVAIAATACFGDKGPGGVLTDCASTPTCGQCMAVRPGSTDQACGWCVPTMGAGSCIAAGPAGAQPASCSGKWIVKAAVNSCPAIAPPDGGKDPNL